MPILPILCFGILIGLCSGSWRQRFLMASVGWGVIVLIVTEGLSLWHGLDRIGLSLAWAMLSIIFGSLLWKKRSVFPKISVSFNFKIILIVTMVMGILLATATVAFFAAPNNWDSMTYHLARVAHWAQDKSIAMFPTAILRQIAYPAWSSYAVAQFYILADGDRWVNFIQWFSSLGCMIGASLIVARFKGDIETQALAALIVATIPMGILQSTSTQNDYVVGFWLVCFAYFGISIIQESTWVYVVVAGASLGLAWLVKGTGYIYGFPFLIWFTLAGCKRHGRQFLLKVGGVLLIALLMNSTYYMRNLSLSGSVMPASESAHVVNKTFDVKVLMTNFILNMGLHASTVWDVPNQWVENAIGGVLHWSGIQDGDRRLYLDSTQFVILDQTFRYHEDYAGNFIHAVLIILCTMTSFFWWRRIDKDGRQHLLTLLAAVFLFVLTIKWSLFHSRYHLPLFILFAPFVALVWGVCFRSWGRVVLAIILTVASITWLTGNKSRPLIGPRSVVTNPRMDQYFTNNIGYANYVYPLGIAAQVDCKQIGIVLGGDTWEYPLRVIAKLQNREDIRFEHIMVGNESQKLAYPLGDFDPCVIIKSTNQGPQFLNWQGHSFTRVDQRWSLATYIKSS